MFFFKKKQGEKTLEIVMIHLRSLQTIPETAFRHRWGLSLFLHFSATSFAHMACRHATKTQFELARETTRKSPNG
jgi:hypothetical protein